MGTPLATNAFALLWIPFAFLFSLASTQVSGLSKTEQTERLNYANFQCYKRRTTEPVTLEGSFCNRTWDNVMCWPDTAAGTVGYLPCPIYINGFDQAEYATKHCLENGTWFQKPGSGTPWTNFSACIKETPNKESLPELIVEHMPGIKLMYTIGYSLSLAALILAVTIMIYFKRLHCQRNMIHIHMFVAFLLRAGISLLKSILLVNDLGFPNDVNNTGDRIEFIQEGTHWPCKLFFTLVNYILMTSIMWLFNEGLYLVLILSVSVFADKTKMWRFCLLGWASPVIFVIPWAVCRVLYDDMMCWNVHVKDEFFWIVRGPMIASVAVNFLFFVNIVRMLFTKLTATNCPESKKVRYRKLAKSTLILIPLFAVYYMGFIWLPDGLSPASDLFKIYVEMLFNSFQGFLVALLFCFLNAEVQNEIRKKWQRLGLTRSGSWRSNPSIGSFLRRSVQHKGFNSHQHSSALGGSRAFGSEAGHSTADTGGGGGGGVEGGGSQVKVKVNGHVALSPISEETTLLNGSSPAGRSAQTTALVCRGSGSSVAAEEPSDRDKLNGGGGGGHGVVVVAGGEDDDVVRECGDVSKARHGDGVTRV